MKPNTLSYLHTDHLRTPRRATSEAGDVVWSWDSDAFGKTAANDDADNDGISTIISLRFAGQYYDAETGLHYNYFRYYDPQTGRYITSDPIGLEGGLNTYGYVGGNPLSFVDPNGEAASLAAQGTWFATQQVGKRLINPALNWAILRITGEASLGLLLYAVLHNESVDDDSNDDEPKKCDGTITDKEREILQDIADKWGVQIDVVGSRARGEGRNIDRDDLPVGKAGDDFENKSDIDIRIDGQDEIDSGGRLNDDIRDRLPHADVRTRHNGGSYPPVIVIKPRR